MKTQLSIQERLKDLRVEKGMTLEQLSQQTKIPASTLGSYESDDYKEIPHRNIIELAKFYGVSTDYLLGMTENRQLDNISISDLHLSDAALSLLKDRKLNTQLLSELITHEQFRKLMLDLEIYVDGLADMQVKSLNLAVETGRKILLKRHNPDEYNLQLNVLKASHLELNEYFSHVIDDDMHTIIRDIRNAHKGDIDSAPSKTVTEYFEGIIEKAENFVGTSKQKLAYIFSQFLKIKPTEKNIDDIADILGQSEILEPDAKKRRNSARQKNSKPDKN
ncbi:helix-turn-helix transcriptional regulator [Lachnospiraceae bacterium 38-14]